MGVAINEEHIAAGLRGAVRHGHCLGCGGAFIEQRCAGELKPGQVCNHLLEVQQRFQPALADFGLVGRIGGVPAGVFQDVAQDDLGRDAAIVPHADHRGEQPVAPCDAAQVGQGVALGQGSGKVEWLPCTDVGRDDLVHQVVERPGADGVQHVADLGITRADVTRNEVGAGLQVGQALALGCHAGSSCWCVRRGRAGGDLCQPCSATKAW
jgi:hypothetical protein